MLRPSGTVTFLFTDIEGSTRRWETDADAMRSALAEHDEVLRSAIEAHAGWLFKHTGDGVCAAFSVAGDSVAAAIDAQRRLGLPVRMGIATGSAESRGDDYFGPTLNRAARIMAAAHGGQVVLAAATAALISGDGLMDLGERRLRDMSGVEHLFQVQADGLKAEFPPLRTLDVAPGNLPVSSTSFIGREVEMDELIELIRAQRLVTLTGVGGVGKTRLALRVAAELADEFPDGAWLVELAPVGDPDALPDVLASALGVTPVPGLLTSEAVAQALSGRRLLLVLDNCEHVLDAAAALTATILARASSVKVLATSREGLQLSAEHAWRVPSLAVGVDSAAMTLFVDRAKAAKSGFALDTDTDKVAVSEICRRLDGIALAIELAAARMLSMSPTEVRDRLGDRFRLLTGGRRGLERHQTLRHAVGWSYDLLTDDERSVLQHCSVFAGGFDLAAALAIASADRLDEYALLDVVDSLVRKSLLTATSTPGRTRYGMLETIRQFAEEQLATDDTITEARNRHAEYFADHAVASWDRWDGPGYEAASEWVEEELSNLRIAYRWAAGRGDLVTATAVAAHTTMLTFALQRVEPVAWVEEILENATAARVAHLPRLYTAASMCMFAGRAEAALSYAGKASQLETDRAYDAFEFGWASWPEALAHLFAGRIEHAAQLLAALADEPGRAGVYGRCLLLPLLPGLERTDEAMTTAEEALSAARRLGNPLWVAYALYGYGLAFADAAPTLALAAWREGLAYARTHRVPSMEAVIARDSAGLEATHGEPAHALDLFDTALASFHQAGDAVNLDGVFGHLAVFFDRTDRFEVAATVLGIVGYQADDPLAELRGLPAVADHLRVLLGEPLFALCTATGAAMDLGAAVAYARAHIHDARGELASSR